MSTKGHYLLGLIREQQGQLDEAVREFKRVLYIDRSFALAHINLANIYRTRHMAADAVKEYNNAIAGLAHGQRGDWADFAGGFLEDVLIEICRRNIAQLA
jgi:chemotaxis protein methyltransferase CheR